MSESVFLLIRFVSGMMTLGCLPLLMEIYRTFEKRPDVLFKLFTLISNISGDVNKEFRLRDFFASGKKEHNLPPIKPPLKKPAVL